MRAWRKEQLTAWREPERVQRQGAFRVTWWGLEGASNASICETSWAQSLVTSWG